MIVIRPLWAWVVTGLLGFVSLLAFVRDEFLNAPAAAELRIVPHIPPWPWSVWGLCCALAMIAIIFEGSFRAYRQQQTTIEALEKAAREVSVERPIRFLTIGLGRVGLTEDRQMHLLSQINFLFENTGPRPLNYDVKKSEFWVNDIAVTASDPDRATGIISAGERLTYGGNLSIPLLIPTLPFMIKLHLIMEYDNVPPLATRTMETETLYTFHSVDPMRWDNLILRRDER